MEKIGMAKELIERSKKKLLEIGDDHGDLYERSASTW